MSYNADVKSLLWLTSLQGVGILKKHALLSLVSSPRELFDNFELLLPKVNTVIESGFIEILRATRDKLYIESLLETLDKKEIVALSYLEPEYPETLKELPDFPLILFLKGRKELLNTPSIGVVGTREPTRYGKQITEKFVGGLSKSGLTIISGMARGIDTIAHETCLKNGGKTIAVLGSGADVIYPSENKDLYLEIVFKGLIVSEYMPESAPRQYRFPERNRLISGISKGILVTEAGLSSGSLITASCAVEQNKRLFLVPGNVTSMMSEGVNNLIKTLQGAMVTDVNDILYEFGMKESDTTKVSEIQLDMIEELILAELNKSDLHFDQLSELTALTVKELNALLTKMELFGLIKKLVGNYYGV